MGFLFDDPTAPHDTPRHPTHPTAPHPTVDSSIKLETPRHPTSPHPTPHLTPHPSPPLATPPITIQPHRTSSHLVQMTLISKMALISKTPIHLKNCWDVQQMYWMVDHVTEFLKS